VAASVLQQSVRARRALASLASSSAVVGTSVVQCAQPAVASVASAAQVSVEALAECAQPAVQTVASAAHVSVEAIAECAQPTVASVASAAQVSVEALAECAQPAVASVAAAAQVSVEALADGSNKIIRAVPVLADAVDALGEASRLALISASSLGEVSLGATERAVRKVQAHVRGRLGRKRVATVRVLSEAPAAAEMPAAPPEAEASLPMSPLHRRLSQMLEAMRESQQSHRDAGHEF